MQSLPTPKKAVALIRSAFCERNSQIQTKDAYNLLAQVWGFKDWATYRGMHPKEAESFESADKPQSVPFARSKDEIKGWPTWVVCSRYDDNHEEYLRLLPFGATIENRLGGRHSGIFINDDDAIRLSLGFTDPGERRESFQDLVVATRVASEYPDSGSYGFPMFANECEVAGWLEGTMGWGYLADERGISIVDTLGHDRGDDGLESWWVELCVHPSVHERLLRQFLVENIDFDCIWPRVVLDEAYLEKADPQWDARVAYLLENLERVFVKTNMLDLAEIFDAFHFVSEDQDKVMTAQQFLRWHFRESSIELRLEHLQLSVQALKQLLEQAIEAAAKQPVK